MKRTMTKMFSAISALMIGAGCFSIGAGAKVIEPEVVKTESWTTSYYIDDDVDTLYPYIQCEADIYNDGTIKLYMWNTHEWDGFATVSHTATIINTVPVSQDSMVYAFWKNTEYIDKNGMVYGPSNEGPRYIESGEPNIPSNESNPYLKLNLSYYAKEYNFEKSSRIGKTIWSNSSFDNKKYSYYYYSTTGLKYSYSGFDDYQFYYPQYSGALPKLDYYTESSVGRDAQKYSAAFIFQPTEDPTGTYNFRLFGHDITITPELLSGNIVAEPELTEQEKQIKKLEEENKTLQNKLQSYDSFDSDGDGLLTSADAQMILVYYAEYLAGATSGKTGDYAAFIQTFKGQ